MRYYRLLFSLVIMMILMSMGALAHTETQIFRPVSIYYDRESVSDSVLNDGDLKTVLNSDGYNSFTLEFAEVKVPLKVKLYITEVIDTLSLVIEYRDIDGIWVQLPGTGNISGYQLVQGWNSWQISEPIEADAIRLFIHSGDQAFTGIGELEVWGQPSRSLIREYNYPGEFNLPVGSIGIWSFFVNENLERLNQVVFNYQAYDLGYREGLRKINGKELLQTPPVGGEDRWVKISEELHPDQLISGINTIEFRNSSNKANGFRVKNLKVRLIFDQGQIEIKEVIGSENSSLAYRAEDVIDQRLDTYWETEYTSPTSAFLEFDLGSEYDLEYLDLYQAFGFNFRA